MNNSIFRIKCVKAYFNAKGRFFFAVYRKLAESVSFCVRKFDFPHTSNFPALVRENQLFWTETKSTDALLSKSESVKFSLIEPVISYLNQSNFTNNQ